MEENIEYQSLLLNRVSCRLRCWRQRRHWAVQSQGPSAEPSNRSRKRQRRRWCAEEERRRPRRTSRAESVRAPCRRWCAPADSRSCRSNSWTGHAVREARGLCIEQCTGSETVKESQWEWAIKRTRVSSRILCAVSSGEKTPPSLLSLMVSSDCSQSIHEYSQVVLLIVSDNGR